MLRILFVDDDPLILAGLKRLFRRFEREWQAEYVTSGEEALQFFAQAPFDVVVSDLRMPAMDGAALLSLIRERYPRVIRVILTGICLRESGLRTLSPAHQCLTKPCDPIELRNTIHRVSSLQRRLQSAETQRLLDSLALPPDFTPAFHAIVEELNAPRASTERLTTLVAAEPQLAEHLLQLTNSSYFGLSQKYTSVHQAVQQIGLSALHPYLLCAGVLSQFPDFQAPGFSLHQLIDHGTEVGQFARQIAREITNDEQQADEAYLAGLLHDIGKQALASSLGAPYADILRTSRESGTSLWETERSVLGTTHAEVGGGLLDRWGVPLGVVEAVALHHEPRASDHSQFTPLTAVHLANGILHEQLSQWSEGESGCRLDGGYLERLGVQHIPEQWLSQLGKEAEQFTAV